MNIQNVRKFLAEQGLSPNRDLGQNFLIDESLVEKIVVAAGVSEGDTVIEIGTGLGILTRVLAKRAASIVSIEIDSGLVRALREAELLPGNVELIHADALKFDFEALLRRCEGRVRLVANLPYSVSSPLLRRLLDLRDLLEDWSVMLQSEVAERLVAEPCCSDYGSLTVIHRLCVETTRLLNVNPQCFHPAPQVSSTVLRMTPLAKPLLAPGELEWVERVVRAAFGQRRKMLPKALASGLGGAVSSEQILKALTQAGIDRTLRAEAVEPEGFLALARALEERNGTA